MTQPHHLAIFFTDKVEKGLFAQQLLNGKATGSFTAFNYLHGLLFSTHTLNSIIEEELRHGHLQVAKAANRLLQTLSDGEQKKALLHYLLKQKPDYIILDNPFDNLDKDSQESLMNLLLTVAENTIIIQLLNRSRDLLPFINIAFTTEDGTAIAKVENIHSFIQQRNEKNRYTFSGAVPSPHYNYNEAESPLVRFNNVTVKYNDHPIVNSICWSINAGECWQLIGPNGSGKTTLLSLITGDNPKAYGQDITLFGRKKGTGETIWDIKQNIGYFTPSITSQFSRYDSVEQMLMGGFFDSIGLYTKPSDTQQKIAGKWLELIELLPLKKMLFHQISLGQQRVVLIARAMIKHPPLLILDEPTTGLDDYNAGMVVALINKISAETNTAIIFVSHRTEAGLLPDFTYTLTPHQNGSVGNRLLTTT